MHHLSIIFSFLFPSETEGLKRVSKEWHSVLHARLLVNMRDQSVLHSHVLSWDKIESPRVQADFVIGTHKEVLYICDDWNIYAQTWNKQRSLDPLHFFQEPIWLLCHGNLAMDTKAQFYILTKNFKKCEILLYSKQETPVRVIEVKIQNYHHMHVRNDLIFLLDATKIYIWKSSGSFVAEWDIPLHFKWRHYEAAVYGKEFFLLKTSPTLLNQEIRICTLQGQDLRSWKRFGEKQVPYITGIFIENRPIIYLANLCTVEAFTYSGKPLFTIPYQWNPSSLYSDIRLEDPYLYIVEQSQIYRFQIEHTKKSK